MSSSEPGPEPQRSSEQQPNPQEKPRLFRGLTGWLLLLAIGLLLLTLYNGLTNKEVLSINELQEQYWDSDERRYRGIRKATLEGTTRDDVFRASKN